MSIHLWRRHSDDPPQEWHDKVMRKCQESVEIKNKFFEHYAEQIGELSQKMAERFSPRAAVMGDGQRRQRLRRAARRGRIHASDHREAARSCRRSIWSARCR